MTRWCRPCGRSVVSLRWRSPAGRVVIPANPWVGRHRSADGGWIHLHGGFPPLVARLADVLGLPHDSDESAIAASTARWESVALETRSPSEMDAPRSSAARTSGWRTRRDRWSVRWRRSWSLCLDPLGDDSPRCCRARPPTTRPAWHWLPESWQRSMRHPPTVLRRIDASLCQTAARILRVRRLLGDSTHPSGSEPELLRSDTDFGVVEHLGPCVGVDGLDVGWARPTTPRGQGALTW